MPILVFDLQEKEQRSEIVDEEWTKKKEEDDEQCRRG
jgi:hypothetical protein